MNTEILHASLPRVPNLVWDVLARDAEEKPMAVQIVGYVAPTETLIVGQCVDGIVRCWHIRCPVLEPQVRDELHQLQIDPNIPKDAVQYRQFDRASDEASDEISDETSDEAPDATPDRSLH